MHFRSLFNVHDVSFDKISLPSHKFYVITSLNLNGVSFVSVVKAAAGLYQVFGFFFNLAKLIFKGFRIISYFFLLWLKSVDPQGT